MQMARFPRAGTWKAAYAFEGWCFRTSLKFPQISSKSPTSGSKGPLRDLSLCFPAGAPDRSQKPMGKQPIHWYSSAKEFLRSFSKNRTCWGEPLDMSPGQKHTQKPNKRRGGQDIGHKHCQLNPIAPVSSSQLSLKLSGPQRVSWMLAIFFFFLIWMLVSCEFNLWKLTKLVT